MWGCSRRWAVPGEAVEILGLVLQPVWLEAGLRAGPDRNLWVERSGSLAGTT